MVAGLVAFGVLVVLMFVSIMVACAGLPGRRVPRWVLVTHLVGSAGLLGVAGWYGGVVWVAIAGVFLVPGLLIAAVRLLVGELRPVAG